jgi:hypothetical protein
MGDPSDVGDFRVPTLALSPPERGGEHHGRGEQYLVAKIILGEPGSANSNSELTILSTSRSEGRRQ